jgi:hypothetical protein
MAWASGVLERRAAHRSRYALIVSQLAVLLHSPVVSDVVDSWIESLRTGGLHLGGGQDGFVRVKTVGAAKRNLVLRTRQAGSPEVGGQTRRAAPSTWTSPTPPQRQHDTVVSPKAGVFPA